MVPNGPRAMAPMLSPHIDVDLNSSRWRHPFCDTQTIFPCSPPSYWLGKGKAEFWCGDCKSQLENSKEVWKWG